MSSTNLTYQCEISVDKLIRPFLAPKLFQAHIISPFFFPLLTRTTISVETDAAPKTPDSPPDDLERQTLDSLEGLTSVVSYF